MPAAPAPAAHIRSLYRSILRELPARPPSTPSPIQQRIRSSFASSASDGTAGAPGGGVKMGVGQGQYEEAEQYIQYVKAQRMYVTLLERYNPGISGIDEEERVRLSARRVGMDLPDEFPGRKKEGKKE